MKLTNNDFEQLTVNSANWREHAAEWKLQEERFDDIKYRGDFFLEIDYSFARVYWFEDYPSILFAKAFLESLGHEYRVYWDNDDDTYMITTNYGGVL